MKRGGNSNEQTQWIIRGSGLIAALAISLYTVLISAGWITPDGYDFWPPLGYGMATAWLVAGTAQYAFFSLTRRNIFIRIAGFHVLATAYILLITGFASLPFLACWILLGYATYSYYAFKGAGVSVAILWLLSIIDGLSHTTTDLANNIAIATSLTIVAIVTIMITRAQERDETEFEKSKQAESLQRESLQTLINNIADAVISTDESGTIRLYNAATIGLLDTNENLVGKTIDDVLHLKDEAGESILIESLLQNAKAVVTNDKLRSTIGDEEIRIELTYSPIRGAYTATSASVAESGYILILRDVTKSKSLEEERDEFISVVSHELRTPITIAEGSIDNAQLVFKKDPTKTDIVEKSLKMAHDQVVFLSRMVNDLSTLSRAERGVADEPEVIDVGELTHALYEEYAPQASQKGLVLNLSAHEPLGKVYTSRLYLHELLQNFITNAIKYTKEGSVTLSVTRSDGQIHFAVSDTGIGMSKTDQAKVFEKFYRSEDYRTRETGGTGLGLYVSEKLARKMHTKITLESRLNHGSKFGFSLPLAPEQVDKT